MGVLMSKKQTVEKVQKASVVVSAFKEGLKDKGSTRSKAEPPPGKLELVEPGPDQDKEVAGSSQPCTEEAKRNQAAWERLRDGKGVEPEELEWDDRATPPAFIRPKRQLGDDESLDINLQESGEVINDEMCDVCEVWTADDLYPCRICTRVFHDGCLRRVVYLSPSSIQELKETAHTTVGWSCQYCDNVNLLLTEEEMFSLKEVFQQCRIIPGEGSNSLLRMLTAKEQERARSYFLSLDQNRDGLITGSECKRAQHSWFHKNPKESQSCNVSISHVGPISESSPASRGRGRAQDKSLLYRGQEENRRVDWKTFLKENAIYVLAARPNSAAIHLRPTA
ncbi:PHD finger protein 24 [Heptranchias perlo]|uniref:PHD finger protein 24 n=1 Tax=Heptranchias perlo TaxID=212740 RepID=UPI00355A8361